MAGVLDAGDKIASIASALIGLISLAVSIAALRRMSRPDRLRTMTDQRVAADRRQTRKLLLLFQLVCSAGAWAMALVETLQPGWQNQGLFHFLAGGLATLVAAFAAMGSGVLGVLVWGEDKIAALMCWTVGLLTVAALFVIISSRDYPLG